MTKKPPERKHPSWWRCDTCGHTWIVMYLPMLLDLAAKVMKHAHCPMCGQDAKRLFAIDPPAKRRTKH